MTYDFYAFRLYDSLKRTDQWNIRIGRYSTGKGIILTTRELERFEKEHKVKRVHRRE